MLKEFNNFFGIREDMPFQRTKLENALIEKFGSIQYFKYSADEHNETCYTCGTKFEWEANDIECNMFKYYTPDEALMGLFIEQCTEPELDIDHIDWYYTDLSRKNEVEFREIIKEVYNV